MTSHASLGQLNIKQFVTAPDRVQLLSSHVSWKQNRVDATVIIPKVQVGLPGIEKEYRSTIPRLTGGKKSTMRIGPGRDEQEEVVGHLQQGLHASSETVRERKTQD